MPKNAPKITIFSLQIRGGGAFIRAWAFIRDFGVYRLPLLVSQTAKFVICIFIITSSTLNQHIISVTAHHHTENGLRVVSDVNQARLKSTYQEKEVTSIFLCRFFRLQVIESLMNIIIGI